MKEKSRRLTPSPLSKYNKRTESQKAEAAKHRLPFGGESRLYEVAQLRLLRAQRLIEANVSGHKLMPGETVLVRVNRNVLVATVASQRYRRVVAIDTLPYVIRLAQNNDLAIDKDNEKIEAQAQELATRFALDHELPMKVLSTDLSHDHKNITINFASDVRVDFREMVSYLSNKLKMRVEMFQLGLRNGTGLLYGMGSCGQRLCCGRFLGQFEPVAVKVLRAQGLATNPKRISGICGRLYCCMSYEYNDYLRENRQLPKKGRRVLTRRGLGRIADIDGLRDEVVVNYDNGESQRLTVNDFVPASEEIIAKVESEALVFPLENAKFYLNNDPSQALPLSTKFQPPAQSSADPARTLRHSEVHKASTRTPKSAPHKTKISHANPNEAHTPSKRKLFKTLAKTDRPQEPLESKAGLEAAYQAPPMRKATPSTARQSPKASREQSSANAKAEVPNAPPQRYPSHPHKQKKSTQDFRIARKNNTPPRKEERELKAKEDNATEASEERPRNPSKEQER